MLSGKASMHFAPLRSSGESAKTRENPMTDRCPRVLIVDDRMESIALLLSYLKGQSIDVMVAIGGADGVRKALNGQPDAVLLDVAMPGMDGYTVCRQLKADPRTAAVPVIFLSANSAVMHKLEGFAAGGVDYITKPFRAEEVLARLYVHLRIQREVKWLDSAPPGMAALRDSDLVAEAIAELQQDQTEWFGVEALARSIGTNEKKLTELFRQQFGMTVVEYRVEMLMEKARWELANTDYQIKFIADTAGYNNASDFSRAFKKRYSIGPRQYRQTSTGLLDNSESA
jgi:DNA-binding response OmpR family regulator